MSHPTPPVVTVESVSFSYAGKPALDDVSFTVGRGEMFGLLGPNGGGKTTLLKILGTLLRPTRGRATVAGFDTAREVRAVRRSIGVVFQSPALDRELSVAENLRHHGHMFGLKGAALGDRIEAGLARMSVLDRANDRVDVLSGGLQRRVELAKGLLHDPSVLLLDEPTVGLDPGVRRELWRHLRSLCDEAGVSVIVATHLMDEAEACDRVAIMHRGALVALDAPATLRSGIRGDVIVLETDHGDALARAIKERFRVEPKVVDGTVQLEQDDGAALVPRLAEAFPGEIRSITVGKPTLEDVFLQRTGRRFDDAREVDR